jgi:outer membrane protein OmpA-like peptidoglycan-associated protein
VRVVGLIAWIALQAGASTAAAASTAARPTPADVVRPGATPNDVAHIVERVAFAYDSAELTPATSPALDAIAAVLKEQPKQLPLVALEGHAADNEHTSMKLSLARASAVRLALLARGVESDRLLARASGATAPSCTERNETCRARERTVEFLTIAVPKPSTAAGEGEGSEVAGATPATKPAAAPAPPVSLARIEFQKGSAVMAPAVLADLDLLAGFMKVNPVSLEIVGYADGAEGRAPKLAQSRADAVRAYMMACGVSGQHLVTRTEQTTRATCRSHSANCPARKGRAEIHFFEGQAPGAPSP